jgi:hypothetical protein
MLVLLSSRLLFINNNLLILLLVINIAYIYLSGTYLSVGIIGYEAIKVLDQVGWRQHTISTTISFTLYENKTLLVFVYIVSVIIGVALLLFKSYRGKSEDSILRLFSTLTTISLCKYYRKSAIITVIASMISYIIAQVFLLQYTLLDTILGLLLLIALLPILASLATNGIIALLIALNASLGLYTPKALLPLFAMVPIQSTIYLESPKREDQQKRICIGHVEAVLVKSPPIVLKLKYGQGMGWGWQNHLERPVYCLEASISEGGHILITGMTGSGKSTLASIIAYNYGDIASVLIIDPHGEYKHRIGHARIIDATQYSVNPLELSGVPPSIRAGEIAQLISSLYRLGPLQQRLLEDAIKSSYEAKGIRDDDPATWAIEPPTLDDVKEVLNGLAVRDSRAAVLVSYLNSLQSAVFRHTAVSIQDLLEERGLIIFDLSKLATFEQKRLYVETLLRLLYSHVQRLGVAERPRLLIIVDEAHIFAPKTSKVNILSKMYAEMRKYGINLLCITQQVLDIDKTIVANSSYIIALRQTEPREKAYLAKILSGFEEKNRIQALEETLTNLPQGYAIVRDRRFDEPILISVLNSTQKSI